MLDRFHAFCIYAQNNLQAAYSPSLLHRNFLFGYQNRNASAVLTGKHAAANRPNLTLSLSNKNNHNVSNSNRIMAAIICAFRHAANNVDY
jgi:hypothetical protein